MIKYRQQSEVRGSQPMVVHARRRAKTGIRLAAAGIASLIAALVAAPVVAGTNGGPKNAAPSAMRVSGPPGDAPDSRSQLLGASLAEWTQQLWVRSMSIPLNVNPVTDKTGIHCSINQSGPVWFLAAAAGETLDLTCTIPAGKAVIAPAAAYINDYPCPPSDPAFEPAPGQTLEAFLSGGATGYIDTFTASASLDGRALPLHRVNSGLFPFTGAADVANVDGCVTGSPQLAVADGWYAIVGPLPRGTHTLSIHASSTFPNSTPTNNRITLIVR